jgi:hypothetical protein
VHSVRVASHRKQHCVACATCGFFSTAVQLRLSLQIYPDILRPCVGAYRRILALASEHPAASGVETQPLSNRTLKYLSFCASNSALIHFTHLLEVDKMIDS